MYRILLTGGAGFIGHHVVDYILQNTDYSVVLLDRLDLSGNLQRLRALQSFDRAPGRVEWVWHDLKAPINEHVAKAIGEVDFIVHLAASSHVDRSIEDPLSFVMDNVVGTTNLLNFARGLKGLKQFMNFSTDEVFGPASVGYAHKEDEPHRPSNPYAASKSGQESIGYSFYVTYGLPVTTTHTMNNFGERQHPEKLVPKTIRHVLQGIPMPIFSELDESGRLRAVGSRFWIHCWNTASAIVFLLEKGKPGESYNIIGFDEFSNLEMAEKVASLLGKKLIPEYVDFHKARPGHDRRYALDGSKLASLGWKPEISFDESLRRTVQFALEQPHWQ